MEENRDTTTCDPGPQHSCLMLEKPDMSPEEYLSTASKMIREECIRQSLENWQTKKPQGMMICRATTSQAKTEHHPKATKKKFYKVLLFY